MKMDRTDNTVSLIPETVKEALMISRIQREMYDEGYDATEHEEDEKTDTCFIFGVLKRPGPRPKKADTAKDEPAFESKAASSVPPPQPAPAEKWNDFKDK